MGQRDRYRFRFVAATFATILYAQIGFAEARAAELSRRHPGSIVRVGAGLGAYVGPNSTEFYFSYPFAGSFTSTRTVTGLAIPFELAIGWPIAHSVVLGATASGAGVPVLERRARPRFVGALMAQLEDYTGDYDGFHFQLGVGAGTVAQERQRHAGVSFAAAAGVGYEWRLSNSCDFGLLTRPLVLVDKKPTLVAAELVTLTWM